MCFLFSSNLVFDASVKVPIGVEHGAIYQFGNYDQCMAATSERSTSLKPRYCLADVTMAGYTVRTGAARRFMVCILNVNLFTNYN